MNRFHPNTLLGLFLLAAALVILFLWLPFDTETGLYEIRRRRATIGDALAPAFGASLLALAAVLLLIGTKTDDAARLTRDQVVFLGAIIGLVAVAMLLMRWTGPMAASLAGAEEYRLLRDTVPWKYFGFALGGFILVTGLAALVERRVTRGAVLAGLFAVGLIIAIYDLPFDDLLLPPNGDVG